METLSFRLGLLEAEAARTLFPLPALLEEIDLYETAEGKSAASVQALQLTCDELRRHYLEKCQEVKDLGLKVSRLQSLSSTSTQTSVMGTARMASRLPMARRESAGVSACSPAFSAARLRHWVTAI